MYDFAIVALMALAVVKVVDFLTDNIPGIARFKSLLTFVLAIVAVMGLDYSVFEAWGIGIRNHDYGVWMTGFMVAGATVPWRAMFGWLTHDHATRDDTLGEHTPMLSRAA